MAKLEKLAAASTEAAPATGGMRSYLVVGMISLVAGAAGFVLPQVLSGGASTRESVPSHESTAKNGREFSGNQQAFVPFGEVVVNLAEDRLTRYLQVSVTLLVDGPDESAFKQALEKKRTILKNWLISYLSDKAIDEVRGAAGVNRARREIQDQFNTILFPDGSETIRDVFFEEFTVR